MSEEWTPLFPLRTVLFPDGPLPLRIFEPRYLDMVSRCLRDDHPFGVLLLTAGAETGAATGTANVGTLARIADWYQGSDGLLGITALGTQRFRLRGIDRQDDGLYVGRLDLLGAEPVVGLPQRYLPLADMLAAILDDLGKLYDELPRHLDDATWVGCRYAEIVPMSLEQRQQCLEFTDPIERLEFVRPMLRAARCETTQ